MKNQAIFIYLFCLVTACTHTADNTYYEPVDVTQTEPEPTNKIAEITGAQQENLLKNLSKLKYHVNPDDERIFIFLANKDIITDLEKAILTLGSSHLFMRYKKTDEKFSQTTSSASLVQFVQKYNVNALYNFKNNFYLNNTDALAIAHKITSYAPNETKELQEIITNKKIIWHNKLSAITNNTTPPPVPESEEQKKDDNYEENLNFESSELYSKDGQELFAQVKILVDQEKYNEAILLLKEVKEDSLYYITAKSRIKTLSNLAAEELRQSAAESFNRALPTSDISARMKYLVHSKKLLLKAKQLYPESDQIDTINQNLEIIESNLKLLSIHP
jgi:hypothetical protein